MKDQKKYIITITRQFGSMGRPIAQKMSEILGIEYYDRDIVDQAAKKLDLPASLVDEMEETAQSSVSNNPFSRMVYPLGRGTTDKQDKIFHAQQNIIRFLAEKESCIIVGRCADKILEETEGLISLFIYAPMEARVKEIMRRYETDEKEAEYLIKQADKIRKNYYNFYAKKTWADKASYDMLIDSSRISEKELAAMLRALLTARGVELETDGSDQ